MKNFLVLIFVLFLSSNAFSQQNLPPEIKGNWLNSSDSIEWLYSFQPKFAVFDTKFWDYKSISRKGNEYNLQLVSGKEKKLLTVKAIDSTSLLIAIVGKPPIRCTNQKAQKPDFRNYDTQEFIEPILVDDTAIILGFIEDYDPEVFSKEGQILYSNIIHAFGEGAEIEFIIQPDGRFQVKFRMFNPQSVYLDIDGSTGTTVFAKPGETQMICFNKLLRDVTVDARKWKSISDWQVNHYMGTRGMLSEELILLENYHNFGTISIEQRLSNREVMPQLKYQEWRKRAYEREIQGLDSMSNAMHCSAKARQVMSKTSVFSVLGDLLSYPFHHQEIAQFSQKYIDRLPEINSTIELNLLTSEYKFYVNYLGWFYKMQVLGGIYVDKYIDNMNFYTKYVTDSADLKIISDWNDFYSTYTWPEFMDRNELTDRANDSLLIKKNNNFYNPMMYIASKYGDLAPVRDYNEQMIKEYDFVLNKYNSDLTSQIYCTFHILLLQNTNNLNPDLVEWAKKRITHPLLINCLLETKKAKKEQKQKYSTYAADTHFIDSIACDKNSDDFFTTILKKYKGKVVYIDFWADWCSPCRAEFEPAAKLKQDYAAKDIVFLYFGISCKKNLWEDMIKEKQVEGYHYWLNPDQGKVMYKKFNFKGIPHFLLIDKTGNVQEGEAPKPSSKVEIRERLDELLK